MEIAELTLLSMLLGSNLNHDVGYLDFGMTGSLEQIVIVDEYIAMNRRLLGGVEVSDDTLALNVIADIGPGGDALSPSPHGQAPAQRAVAAAHPQPQGPRALAGGRRAGPARGGPPARPRPARDARPGAARRADRRRRLDEIVEGFTPDA